MAPLFVGLQGGEAGREDDLDFYVKSVHDLWHAERSLSDAAERVRVLERFPEIQSSEEGISDFVGTYLFLSALVLRYALLANASGRRGRGGLLRPCGAHRDGAAGSARRWCRLPGSGGTAAGPLVVR
jgi:hypothetical protein